LSPVIIEQLVSCGDEREKRAGEGKSNVNKERQTQTHDEIHIRTPTNQSNGIDKIMTTAFIHIKY